MPLSSVHLPSEHQQAPQRLELALRECKSGFENMEEGICAVCWRSISRRDSWYLVASKFKGRLPTIRRGDSQR